MMTMLQALEWPHLSTTRSRSDPDMTWLATLSREQVVSTSTLDFKALLGIPTSCIMTWYGANVANLLLLDHPQEVFPHHCNCFSPRQRRTTSANLGKRGPTPGL